VLLGPSGFVLRDPFSEIRASPTTWGPRLRRKVGSNDSGLLRRGSRITTYGLRIDIVL